jgi:hypothetical protein
MSKRFFTYTNDQSVGSRIQGMGIQDCINDLRWLSSKPNAIPKSEKRTIGRFRIAGRVWVLLHNRLC